MGTVLCSTIVSTHHPRTLSESGIFFRLAPAITFNISFDDGRRTTTTIFGCNVNERVNWPPHLNLRRDENPTSRRYPRLSREDATASGARTAGQKGQGSSPTPQHPAVPAPSASFFFFFATWLTPEAQKSLFFVSFSQAACPVCWGGGPPRHLTYARIQYSSGKFFYLTHPIVPSGISVCTPGSRRRRARGQRDLGVAFLPLLA